MNNRIREYEDEELDSKVNPRYQSDPIICYNCCKDPASVQLCDVCKGSG